MQKRKVLAGLIPVMLYTLFLFTNPLYNDVDNIEVATVVGNLYSENNFCQFLHPLLCILIKHLNSLLPATDVFTTLTHLAILVIFSLLLYLGLEGVGKPIQQREFHNFLFLVLILLTVIFMSAGMVIWNVNYNVQTAFFVFSGLIILTVSMIRKKRGFWTVCGTASVALGFMMRIEAALLFIPFIALVLLVWVMERKKGFNRYIIPGVVVIAMLIGSRALFFSTEPYKTAMRYNTARTTCVDFPMRSWRQIPDASGILQVDYVAATSWVYADTEIMNADLLENIAQLGAKNKYSLKADGIQPVLKEMWHRLSESNLYLFIFLIVTLLLSLRNIFFCQTNLRRFVSLLSILGAFIILFYFTVRGRAPIKVWEPVLFATNYALIAMAIVPEESKRPTKRADLVFQLLLCAVLWFSAGQVIAHNEWHTAATPLNAKSGADDTVYADTYESDNIYIQPGWMSSVPRYFLSTDKLPTRRVLEHNVPVGDWTYGQPYYTKFLERIGHPNPIRDLVEQDNVYIMSDSDYILDFLRLHYGEDIELIASGTVNGKTAYRAVHAG